MSELINNLFENAKEKVAAEKLKVEEILKRNEEKKEAFKSTFNLLLNSTIKPGMSEIAKAVKAHNWNCEFNPTNKITNINFETAEYSLHDSIKSKGFTIAFIGNSTLSKVTISRKFFEQSPGVYKSTDYNLSEVNYNLIESIIAESLQTLL